jgi:hypothetical protein
MTALDEHYGFRSELVDKLQRDLLGPVHDEHEELSDAPLTTYVTGILFPTRPNREEVAENIREQDVDLTEARMGVDEVPDVGVAAANMQNPSSMGITFAVDPERATSFDVTVEAAVYEPRDPDGDPVEAKRAERRSTEEQKLRWHRVPVPPRTVTVDVSRPGLRTEEIAPGLSLRVQVRPARAVHGAPRSVAVTAALLNTHTIGAYDLQDAHCFFQPVVSVRGGDASRPALVERPVPVGTDEEEIHVNKLLYRHTPHFAVGHGCAAVWDWSPHSPGDQRLLRGAPMAVESVRTAFVPSYEVLLTDSNPAIDASELDMVRLSSAGTDVVGALRRLVEGYRDWISDREEESRLLHDTEYGRAARAQVELCSQACDRMSAGVDLLRDAPEVMAAFRHANRAMALQRGRTVWIRSGGEGTPVLDGRWRPFQIAFLLLCLNGIVDPGHEDRKVADLLWFPTGGGKTEAYLGLIAFTVFLRRSRRGVQGGGVSALMRYTLRLLTLQQFERAATLICSMETMRRRAPRELGGETISLGMWVGKAATPNTVRDAAASLKKLREGQKLQEEDPVQLRACPWCGTPMDAHNYEADASTAQMRIFCSSPECDFHDALPVHVVDEMIYRHRPTLVIATVDKFAQLAWRPQVAALFNRDIDDGTPPPELIVQDELHLISGPLGSLTGLYETAVDVATDTAKVIASTATIRRARRQARNLFNRDVRQFPPAGLDSRDSWFAVETEADKKASRLYVGLLTPATSQATLLVRSYAALLHHVFTIKNSDKVRDAYWTLVGYFNSLRLLAAAELQVHSDVQDRLKLLADRHEHKPRPAEFLAELTSRVPSSEIPQRLKDLARSLPDEGAFDTVLATNMISVGVDIDRLGLMAIMGQPQTTAEYIQSSSRVGRQHPGLVVMMFNGVRSRDRSHYESFTSYHSALYRQVESTSVTPFSPRARDRALHAVLVGMARLLYPEARDNAAAARVADFEGRLAQIKSLVLNRVEDIAPQELEATADDIDYFFEEWRLLADGNEKLLYEAPYRFRRSDERAPDCALLRSHADEDLDEAFPTLWSMRDVDVESDLYLER